MNFVVDNNGKDQRQRYGERDNDYRILQGVQQGSQKGIVMKKLYKIVYSGKADARKTGN